MSNVMDLFKGVKNVQFVGDTYCEDLGRDLPMFELSEPSVEEWNEKAQSANTKAFIQEFKREPKNYEEVSKWVYSLINDCTEKAVQAGTYTTFA